MFCLLWWLLIARCAFCSDLSSIDIFQSTVYSSSVQSGSRAEFAVDDDLHEEKPTCFQTNNDLPDANGYHWLLIDFGYTLPNVKEIRVVTESGYNLSEISAYTLRKPNMSLHQLVNVSKESVTLEFGSPDIVLCSSTGEVEPWRTATSIQCDQPRDGRWLVLRRNEGMHICMVNVYVTQAHSMCFVDRRLKELLKRLAGVFRLIRHLNLGACRAACMNSSGCNGILYVQRTRYSGHCHLIRHVMDQPEGKDRNELMVDRRFVANCKKHICKYEDNICHEGHRFNLTKKETKGEWNAIKTHLLVDSSLEQSEEWLILLSNSSLYDTKRFPQYLLSVHLQGQLLCDHWQCGQVRVTAIDAGGSEIFCGTIETIHTQQLDKLPLLCESSDNTFPTNITAVRISWRAWHQTIHGGMAKLTVNISSGNVRISKKKLSPKGVKTMASIAPILPLVKIKKAISVNSLKSSEMNDDEYTPLVYPTHLEQLTVISPRPIEPHDALSFSTSTMQPKVIHSIEVKERRSFVNAEPYKVKQHQLYVGQQEPEGGEGNLAKPYGRRRAVGNGGREQPRHNVSDGNGVQNNPDACLSNSVSLTLTTLMLVISLYCR